MFRPKRCLKDITGCIIIFTKHIEESIGEDVAVFVGRITLQHLGIRLCQVVIDDACLGDGPAGVGWQFWRQQLT